jgi:hypothetical protein
MAPRVLSIGLVAALAAAPAVQAAPAEGCHLRAVDGATSHLGLRRSHAQVFEVDIRVATRDGSECRVRGLARLRGQGADERLVFPIRTPGAEPCQVQVALASDELRVATPGAACRATPPCGALIPLDGQRFSRSDRSADIAACFAAP